VLVEQARAVARTWVAEHGGELPGYVGAYLSGSTAWLAGSARLPVTSDVDVTVLTDAASPPAKPGKFRHDGVLLEVTYRSWSELESAGRVLASYHLAGSFRRGADTVLADPSGRLTALSDAVARDFARRPWVRRRCADAERRIVTGLASIDPAAPLAGQVMSWLFPTGVTTHVLLAAGLRNPTVRSRYAAVRDLLSGMAPEFYDELLDLLGCRHFNPTTTRVHLATMTDAFDAAAQVPRPDLYYASDITPAARPIAVDGSRDLIDDGSHREAVFWIAVTHARCATILGHEPPGFRELFADLGILSTADLVSRAQEVLDYLPRLRGIAEEIMAVHAQD
jgi:hypothetical protein